MFHYRDEGNFKLHAFVLMPDHFHILLTPSQRITLERAVQLIKGGSSRKIRQELLYRFPIWQTGFDDHRIRSRADFDERVRYIHDNPAQARLAERPERYAYSSAHSAFAGRVDVWELNKASAAKAVVRLNPRQQPG